jgi:hypothetical protein
MGKTFWKKVFPMPLSKPFGKGELQNLLRYALIDHAAIISVGPCPLGSADFYGGNFLEKSFPHAPFKNFWERGITKFVTLCAD